MTSWRAQGDFGPFLIKFASCSFLNYPRVWLFPKQRPSFLEAHCGSKTARGRSAMDFQLQLLAEVPEAWVHSDDVPSTWWSAGFEGHPSSSFLITATKYLPVQQSMNCWWFHFVCRNTLVSRSLSTSILKITQDIDILQNFLEFVLRTLWLCCLSALEPGGKACTVSYDDVQLLADAQHPNPKHVLGVQAGWAHVAMVKAMKLRLSPDQKGFNRIGWVNVESGNVTLYSYSWRTAWKTAW